MADPKTTSNTSFPTIDAASHVFQHPIKRILTHADLPHFLHSRAHSLLMAFLDHLSKSLTPKSSKSHDTEAYYSDSTSMHVSPATRGIIDLIAALEGIIEDAPPEDGPRRFGNVAFRKWCQLAEEQAPYLLSQHLPESITSLPAKEGGITPVDELCAYLMGSFGSAQRLDFGTGHELSFFAFLCSIWVLGGFEPNKDELGVVLRAFNAYLVLIRQLILLYNLEPAGSHGVWGLDDHSFLPYIFGSAQLAATSDGLGPPAPGGVVEEATVQRERKHNMYMGAVGFIRDVKKGPFWEHSPYLFDISGAVGGWKKINKGMLKMYSAEVLGKFPVVQHFPFGSIFSWELATDFPGSSFASTHSINPHLTSTTSSHDIILEEPTPTPAFSTISHESGDTHHETTRIRMPTPSHDHPHPPTSPMSMQNLNGLSPPLPSQMPIHTDPTPTVEVPGGTAPTVGGIPVTTAPWAKPPTGPSGQGTGSGGGPIADTMGPPATMAPWARSGGGGVDGRPGVVGSIGEYGSSVIVGGTGSLAGGRVRPDRTPKLPGHEAALQNRPGGAVVTKAPWAK